MEIISEIYFSIIPQTLTQSSVSDSAYRVYGTLCRFADKVDGSCYPSISTIGKYCGKSPSTVKRAIKELKLAGFIEVIERFEEDKGQTSNLYIVKFIGNRNGMGDGSKNGTGGRPNVAHKLESSNQSQYIGKDRSSLYKSLTHNIGYEPKTKNEIGKFNKVIKEISLAGGTAEEITDRVEVYKKKWPTMTLTPTAILKHWTMLGQMVEENKPPVLYDCNNNGHVWIDLNWQGDYKLYQCRYCKDEKKVENE